ncbi:hypothetical protein DPMN_022196 [Dreissena polymorpha]|uniref:Uncharacterized protein n=1 Tax=Dreissena polymorpha TaxID=45954 RepID=A0A9D4NP05_DREPO|nr:hypothetical protein DPMN_022196 [Dreissena polymorpha]
MTDSAPTPPANRSSIFFLKVKGLSFSITKEGGCGGVGVGTGDGLVVSSKHWAQGPGPPQLAALFSNHLVHTSPICQLPIVINAPSFDGGCNTSFDWTRKEKQRMDGTDTEGRRFER